MCTRKDTKEAPTPISTSTKREAQMSEGPSAGPPGNLLLYLGCPHTAPCCLLGVPQEAGVVLRGDAGSQC